MSRRIPRIAVAAASFVAVFLLLELFVRFAGGLVGIDPAAIEEYRDYVAGGLKFESRPHTVYARPRQGWHSSNSLGFNDEEWTLERKPGVIRIACLGGSTTESGNAEGRPGTYPWQLERILEKRTGRDFEVMNCGISGWTSAESVAAWFLTILDYRPDLVIVHHAVNDVQPRAHPGFRNDYTHWRHEWREPEVPAWQRTLVRASSLYAWLSIDSQRVTINDLTAFPTLGSGDFQEFGYLPERTSRPFRRNLESIGLSAEQYGAGFMLLTMPMRPTGKDSPGDAVYRDTIPQHNAIMRELAEEHGWLLADPAPWPEEHPEAAAGLFIDICHLTGEGNLIKATYAAQTLLSSWLPSFLER